MNAWQQNSPLGGLPFVKNARSRRESSYDRTGGNRDFVVVPPKETKVIADIRGAGIIKHIWITTRCYEPQYLRKIIIEMYWDDEKNPSVRAPLGDFFGIGHATCRHFVSLPINMVFTKHRVPAGPFAAAMNCYFPMPFANGARIQVINECSLPIENLFYMIDYELIQETPPEDMGRFHATWNSAFPCKKIVPEKHEPEGPWDLPGVNVTGKDNYVILEAEGKVVCYLSIGQ